MSNIKLRTNSCEKNKFTISVERPIVYNNTFSLIFKNRENFPIVAAQCKQFFGEKNNLYFSEEISTRFNLGFGIGVRYYLPIYDNLSLTIDPIVSITYSGDNRHLGELSPKLNIYLQSD